LAHRRAEVEDQHALLVAVAFRGTMGDRRPIQKLLKGRRVSYDAAFKLRIVREALCLPPGNRIKPTCRAHPGIEPVQLRKWIRNIEALEEASPTSRCLGPAGRRANAPARSPSTEEASSDSESSSSFRAAQQRAAAGAAVPPHLVPMPMHPHHAYWVMQQQAQAQAAAAAYYYGVAAAHPQQWGPPPLIGGAPVPAPFPVAPPQPAEASLQDDLNAVQALRDLSRG